MFYAYGECVFQITADFIYSSVILNIVFGSFSVNMLKNLVMAW